MTQITLANTRYGRMFVLAHDEFVGKALLKYGDYSYDEVRIFEQFARPGAVMMDIGANHGYFAFAFSEMVGEEGLVVAVEPQRLIASMLAGSCALSNRSNILVMPVAVGADTGEVLLREPTYEQDFNYGCLSIEALSHETGQPVQVMPIDHIIASLPKPPSFIKIDVEGMELEALRGAAGTLSQIRPWLYVESDRFDFNKAVLTYLESFDYRMYWTIAPLYSADNFNKITENVYGNRVSINFLCVPPGSTLTGEAYEATSAKPECPVGVTFA